MRDEAHAILAAADRLGTEIRSAIDLLFTHEGRTIVTGMGKTGFVARKAAATFCSTGTPAIFLHPSEAMHGDLGIVTPEDVLIAISNSGETAEVVGLLPFMARSGIPVIALTGNLDSSLAKRSKIVLDTSVLNEADEFSVTPTSSTTVALAMCDALAVTLMRLRGFSKEQFAIFHPGGNLGRKLLLRVADLMRVGRHIPKIELDSDVTQAMQTISEKKLGAVMVVSEQNRVEGILTDGDLRRIFQNRFDGHQEMPNRQPVSEFMTRSPRRISGESLAAEALKLMEDHEITVLPVCDSADQLIGIIHLHDLIRAGLA